MNNEINKCMIIKNSKILLHLPFLIPNICLINLSALKIRVGVILAKSDTPVKSNTPVKGVITDR